MEGEGLAPKGWDGFAPCSLIASGIIRWLRACFPQLVNSIIQQIFINISLRTMCIAQSVRICRSEQILFLKRPAFWEHKNGQLQKQ